jgi:hypothetical protein
MTEFRAMCAELVDALDSGIPAGRIRMSPLADRARALLAQPVAEGPSDEEIMELMPQQMRDDLANAARALAGLDRANRQSRRRHAHHPQPPGRRPRPRRSR